MATKVTWNRNSELDMDKYRVYVNGVLAGEVQQPPAGSKPEFIFPPGSEGSVNVSAVDKSGNESGKSSAVFFDNVPPAIPSGLVLA